MLIISKLATQNAFSHLTKNFTTKNLTGLEVISKTIFFQLLHYEKKSTASLSELKLA